MVVIVVLVVAFIAVVAVAVVVVVVSVVEGSLETKVPTIWTHEKHNQEEEEPGRNSDVEKVRREKIRDGESQKREDAGARKGREVAKHCVFPMFCGSGGAKSRLAKAAGAEPDER